MWKALAFLVWVAWSFGLCLAGPSVWHGVDDKTGNTTFFLYWDGASSRLYTPGWVRVNEPTIEGDRFRFRLPYKSYGVKCEGVLSGNQIKGSWQIHQVQYVMKGTWTARQVFTAEGWTPDGFLESGSDVDLVSRLTRNFDDYQDFLSYWNQSVEPEFFAFLTETLYADADGDYRPGLKNERLLRVFETLRSVPRLSLCSQRFLPSLSEARKLLKEKYPWIASDITVVSTFSLGGFDYRLEKFEDRYLLLFGTDWLAKSLTEKAAVGLLAEGLVSSFHFRTLPLGFGGRNEIVRRGVATYCLERLNRPELKYLKLSESGSDNHSAEARGLLRKQLTAKFPDFYAACLAGDNRRENYRVLLEFGRFLAKGSVEPAGLFRLSVDRLRLAVKSFFEAGPAQAGEEKALPEVESSRDSTREDAGNR